MVVTVLRAAQLQSALAEFVRLLQDAVADGATLGFSAPLGNDEARAYWERTFDAAERDELVVLAAIEDNEVVGTAQLAFARLPTSRHRAEVEKVLVRTDARRRGIARALMEEVERTAVARMCTLLLLDTARGSAAEAMYDRLGFRRAGVIPRYTRDPRGHFIDAVMFYKLLE